jgi:hypothetical protein
VEGLVDGTQKCRGQGRIRIRDQRLGVGGDEGIGQNFSVLIKESLLEEENELVGHVNDALFDKEMPVVSESQRGGIRRQGESKIECREGERALDDGRSRR